MSCWGENDGSSGFGSGVDVGADLVLVQLFSDFIRGALLNSEFLHTLMAAKSFVTVYREANILSKMIYSENTLRCLRLIVQCIEKFRKTVVNNQFA